MVDVAHPAGRSLLPRIAASRPVSRRAAGGALVLSAPALVLLLLFVILPTLAVFGLSLTDYQLVVKIKRESPLPYESFQRFARSLRVPSV